LHPVTDRVEHVDFMRVGPKTKLTVSVPLHFTNQESCPGIKAKGILNIVHHHVDIRCAAGSIPEAIEIDLSAAGIGDALKLSQAAMPKGAEVMHMEADTTVANIVEPTIKAEPVEGADAAATDAAAAPAAAAPAEKK